MLVGVISAQSAWPRLRRDCTSALAVIESNLKAQGFEVLLGRDVLGECLLVYDGRSKIYSLAF